MKEKEKSGGKGGIFVIILLIIIIAAAFILFRGGFGFGGDNGSGDDGALPVAGSISEETQPSETESDVSANGNTVNITIAESYIYENNTIALNDLIDKINALENPQVNITIEDSAAANLYEDLIIALDEYNIPYYDVTAGE